MCHQACNNDLSHVSLIFSTNNENDFNDIISDVLIKSLIDDGVLYVSECNSKNLKINISSAKEDFSFFIFNSLLSALRIVAQLKSNLENFKLNIFIDYFLNYEEHGESLMFNWYSLVKKSLQNMGIYEKVIKLNPRINIKLSAKRPSNAINRNPEWHIYVKNFCEEIILKDFEKIPYDTITIFRKQTDDKNLRDALSMSKLKEILNICDDLEKNLTLTNANLYFYNYCNEDVLEFYLQDFEIISSKPYCVNLNLISFKKPLQNFPE